MKRIQETYRVNYEYFSPHQPEEPFTGHEFVWAINNENAMAQFRKLFKVSTFSIRVVNAALEYPKPNDNILNS